MTCGECAWYDYDKDEPDFGDCVVPIPMTAQPHYYDISFGADATDCPCFTVRVCERCGGTGKDDSVADRLSSDPIKPKVAPCPACRKEG